MHTRRMVFDTLCYIAESILMSLISAHARSIGGDGERDEGLLCEEDGTVTVRDSLDALLHVSYT